jgi:hypothetical protein
MLASRTLSVSIARPPAEVYDFVSNPENLPKWVTSFCRSVSKSGDDWIIETSQGSMKIRFAERNALGVLDHYVYPAPGVEVYAPMRVLANGAGSEVIFTLFRRPEMSDRQYAEDAGMIERDLATLKQVLE